MNWIFATGVSMLALGIAPSIAQEQSTAGGSAPTSIECTCPDTGAVNSTTPAKDQSAAIRKDGPTQDAESPPPGQPGASADARAASGGDQVPFPPQDVSDDDLEPYGRKYPSGFPDRGNDDDKASAAADDSADVFEEGETVPKGISRYQGPDMWEGDGPYDIDSDEGPSSLADKRHRNDARDGLSAEQGTAGAWDGRGASRRFDRGDLRPDPRLGDGMSEGDRQARNRPDADGMEPGEQARGNDRQMSDERRLQVARTALRTARSAMPEVRFRTYEFEYEDGRRVVEIAGAQPDDGRRIEVDVYPDGRIRSISEAIPLSAVPDDVRTAVRNELGRFRVAHTMRSLRRDLDVYFEFAGATRSGRNATVEIRADGRDMSVRYSDQG